MLRAWFEKIHSGKNETDIRFSNSLRKAAREYKRAPQRPELATQFWQELIATAVEKSGAGVAIPIVPDCDWPERDIKAELQKGRSLVYKFGLGYDKYGSIFPEMEIWLVQYRVPVPVTDENQTSGWVSTETIVDAPYRNTTEDQLRAQFAREGRTGATLETYILASQANKVLNGRYLDERLTCSILLGSVFFVNPSLKETLKQWVSTATPPIFP